MKKSYLITNIDSDVWKDFKSACAYYDISMRSTLIQHIFNIVRDYKRALSEFKKPKVYTKKGGKKK